MRRRRRSRLRDLLTRLLAFLFSNVGVVVLVFAYTVAGAFIFQRIEGDPSGHNLDQERNSTAESLWNITLKDNLFHENVSKERIRVELRAYQGKVVQWLRRGGHGGARGQWTFSSAFLYSLTVITTIGYGHLSPRTPWGKVITIFYALLGMPLFLLYLANVGELLAGWFKCAYALACLCRGCPGFRRRQRPPPPLDVSEAESIERPEAWRYGNEDSFDRITRGYYPPAPNYNRRPDYLRSASAPQWSRRAPAPAPAPPHASSEPRSRPPPPASEPSDATFDPQAITVPVTVCIFILVGYVIFGSMIFGMWENWDQLDGAYFCFISLSSIGFGDFVPGEQVMTPRIETSFIVCSLYLMLGMALVAMCFNLMQEQVIHYFSGMKRALRRICRCKR